MTQSVSQCKWRTTTRYRLQIPLQGMRILPIVVYLPVATVAPRNPLDIYLRCFPLERGRKLIAPQVVNIVVNLTPRNCLNCLRRRRVIVLVVFNPSPCRELYVARRIKLLILLLKFDLELCLSN